MTNKLTQRDKEIVRYVENYGFITFSQVLKIWFNDCTYAYQVANRRLKAICDMKYLRCKRNREDTIYFIDEKYYMPNDHMILAMDVYAKLCSIDCDIRYFKREQPWIDGRRRSDAYIIYEFNGIIYSLCVEVLDGSATNNSPVSYNNAFKNKYKEICAGGEPQAIFKQYTNYDNIIPDILIVDTRLDFRKDIWDIPEFKTFSVNESLKKISQILI